ncbi:MAG: DUF1573 domain-containing protein [Candidatus Nealsonbacteria bacterium]|nr:DUF1573 domain-containing protein [Candidatus Nealsonbacteria bacterium]
MSRKTILAVVLVLMLGSSAFGQQWARKMFTQSNHDFGSVARGAKVEYEFEFSNIYLEDVHVSSVRASCSCTQVEVKSRDLKTYEKGAIVAKFNTKAFRGARGATLTVTFDKPFRAQVQLHVKGYIRSDVVLNPGGVEFGSVDQGSAAEKRIAVNYAGRSDWRITEVRSANPHVSGEVVERRRGRGQVSYDLVVRVNPSAPAGYLNERLLLVTNDRRSPQVPVHIEGHVQSGITVSPAALFMGSVEPGQKVTKQLVIRGKRPFRILAITCGQQCFEANVSAGQVPKLVHIVPVTFVAGDSIGKVAETLRIETDLGDAQPELAAYAVVSTP